MPIPDLYGLIQPGGLTDQQLGVEAPALQPDLPGLPPQSAGQSFLASLAGLQGVQGPSPRSFGEGLVSGLTQGLGSAGARALAQRQRLEAIQQQQQAMRNQMNMEATKEYRQNRAKALENKTQFDRSHILLTPDIQQGNPELANLPLGTPVTPELAKSKAGADAAGTEAERFNRMSPADQRTYLANKGRLAAASESPEAKMNPEDMKTLVNYTLAGNGLQYNAFGRSKEGQSNRALYTKMLREELGKQGLTEGDLTARQAMLPADKASLSRLTAQKDQLEQFSNTLHDNSDLLLNIAQKIPDVGNRFMNRPLRNAFNQLGDQDVAAFNTSLASVQSEAGRILNSGPTLNQPLTVAAKNELTHLVSGDFTLGQLKGALATIKAESANRVKNQQQQIDSVTGRIGGRGATGTAASRSRPPLSSFMSH